MTQRTTPPFRADHVGSFLRPKYLLEAREQAAKGSLSREELRKVEDKAIAEIVKLHEGQPTLQPLTTLERMADEALSMLRQALDAFANRDAMLAREVCTLDDNVDALYDEFYHEMIQRMIGDPTLIMRATYLIWVSHNLERIADRVTNICERVVYLVTGHMEELNVSSY